MAQTWKGEFPRPESSTLPPSVSPDPPTPLQGQGGNTSLPKKNLTQGGSHRPRHEATRPRTGGEIQAPTRSAFRLSPSGWSLRPRGSPVPPQHLLWTPRSLQRDWAEDHWWEG